MHTESREKYRVLNRDIIKYIAMLTMLLNHISTVFMEPGSVLAEFFLNIGYFTAIIMSYFLVEGFAYTHSKSAYAKRLALFAVISEIPYCLAFTQNGILEFYGMSMMFTLLLCFGILLARENIKNQRLQNMAVTGLFLCSLISDWALLAPMFTLLFAEAKGSERKVKRAFVISAAAFGVLNFAEGIGRFSMPVNVIYALWSVVGIGFAGITIVYLYNGKRMERGKQFSKWFFYLFYPIHLMILGILRVLIL